MPNTKRKLSQNPEFDNNDFRSPPKKNRGALSTIGSQIGDVDRSTYEKPYLSNNYGS